MPEKHYSGNPYQTPVRLRTNAPGQTEEQARTTRTSYRQPQGADEEEDNPDAWMPPKQPTSAIRYQDYSYPSPRNNKQDKGNPKRTQRVRESRIRFDKYTLIIAVSLLVIVMIGGYWLLTSVSNWWTNWQDDLHYGNPRTFQTDQFTGQGDSPDHPDHFIVVNVHGRVVVLQINLQRPDLDQSYGITTTDPNNPVSLFFRQAGKTLAMYVVIGETAPYSVELVSNGTKFVGTH